MFTNIIWWRCVFDSDAMPNRSIKGTSPDLREKAVPLNLSLTPHDRIALDDILQVRAEREAGIRRKHNGSLLS